MTLKNDLDNNLVLQHALYVLSGNIYHRFGLGVALLTLMLSTVQHVDAIRPTWVTQPDQHLDLTCSTSAAQHDEQNSTIEDKP